MQENLSIPACLVDMPHDFLPEKFMVIAEHGGKKLGLNLNKEALDNIDLFLSSLRRSMWFAINGGEHEI